jgi:hypothetical protein
MRGLLSARQRERLRQRLLPKAQSQKPVVTQDTQDFIYKHLEGDLQKLRALKEISADWLTITR